REASEDNSTRGQGGDLGWFPSDAYGPNFGNKVTALEDVQVSQPFRTDAGWHIIERVARRETDVTDENRRAQVRDTIGRRKLEEEYERYLQEMRGEAYVVFRTGDRAEEVDPVGAGACDQPTPPGSSSMLPRLALVPGEPAGVGPELCVRLAQHPRQDCTLVALADPDALHAAAAALGLPLQLLPPDQPATRPGDLPLQEVRNSVPVAFGRPDARNAQAVVDALLGAAEGCLSGRFAGMVTGPVQKSTINEGGIPYTGTTELLAGHAGRDVVMMLANDVVRVALATTHLPLRQVPDAIDAGLLRRVLGILDRAMREDFGIADPVVAVLGLNPHAGEDGHLGHEE